MSEMKANNYLETEPVGTLMKKYAVPCIISLLVAALYNIVDQIFIANASYLGSFGNAANTVVYPLTVVALAIATLIGDGTCAYVSICLGANEKENAHKSVGNAIVLSIISGVILMVVYLVFQKSILTAFGGTVNEGTYVQAKSYFFWISLGIPFYVFGQAMNPVIRSDGAPKFAMASTLAGAVVNIILDPVFIFVFRWGMMGAALATILGQILTAVLSAWYCMHMKAVTLSRESFGIFGSLMKMFLPLGLCSFLSQISLVFSMMAVNNMASKYSALDAVFSMAEYSQIPMAVIGIVMKFFQIVISVSIGLAAGCIPVVGFNIGAGRKDRAWELFKLLLICEAVTGAAALVIVETMPTALISIFGAANESVYYTEFAVKAFRTYLCMMALATVNKGTFIYLQSLGKAVESTALSMIREIVFGVGFALLLPLFFGLDGVLYSMPVSDLLTFVITAYLIYRTYHELMQDEKKAVPAEEETEAVNGAAQTSFVITIGRSYGAGGRSVGKALAKMLNVPFYDTNILTEMAKETGLSELTAASMDEKAVHAGAGYGWSELNSNASDQATETVIRKLAEKPCVIVGRRADRILKDRKNVFRVFLSASMASRTARIMERDALNEKDAENKIRRVDKERSIYYNQRSTRTWGSADTYDLCLDTEKFGYEGSAEMIADCVRRIAK